jgi:methylthioribose-1-phosphate isomerase
MMVKTLFWKKGCLEMIDQRLLPLELKYIKCKNKYDVWQAIKKLKVRGAPAIGIAGAYGVYLGIRNYKGNSSVGLLKKVREVSEYLGTSRPTARNLFWALEKQVIVADNNRMKSVKLIKSALLAEAQKILSDDMKLCRKIGSFGKKIIPRGARVLTHCNAGSLATADYGTALGVFYSSGKKIKEIYVDETRPVLQGSRLTAWELDRAGFNVRLICDNMAAYLMSKDNVDVIVVGADRIASNGDTANKIGTYSLAVNAAYHGIPFYVAAPFSTFDLSLTSGDDIVIEERDKEEVRKIGNKYITVKDIEVYNPAFDVTPAKLIKGIITEKGIINNPDRKKIKAIVK